ncbi:unnamed protein product [Closterium sp. Naga37s-1]|nr:unnamed protein product [Closterium sp. Naga37s-1]
MPAPASVDAMRATQWVPRGTDSTTRDSNEGDSNEGIGCMAAGPFQVEHCLAMEGVEAASGKGRVRVRVVQQFTPVNAAAGGRGGGREGGKGGGNEGRGAGAVAVPRLASLAVHREKWVEPFSGGAELADGAALFSSEMVEEGEGTAIHLVITCCSGVDRANPNGVSRQMETSALEDGTLMLLPESRLSRRCLREILRRREGDRISSTAAAARPSNIDYEAPFPLPPGAVQVPPLKELSKVWEIDIVNGGDCADTYNTQVVRECDTEGFIVSITPTSLITQQGFSTIPDVITNLTRLTSLDLGFIPVRGTLPASMGNMTNLQKLTIMQVASGSIPASFGNMASLQSLSISVSDYDTTGDALTGPIPETFSNLKNLTSLDLTNNNIGPLTDSIGTIPNLEYLTLTGNNFTGSTIPSTITALTNLVELSLDYTGVGGSIPSGLGLLTDLQTLRLDGNKLTGTLPATLGAPQLFTLNYDSTVACPASNTSCVVEQRDGSEFCTACAAFCNSCIPPAPAPASDAPPSIAQPSEALPSEATPSQASPSEPPIAPPIPASPSESSPSPPPPPPPPVEPPPTNPDGSTTTTTITNTNTNNNNANASANASSSSSGLSTGAIVGIVVGVLLLVVGVVAAVFIIIQCGNRSKEVEVEYTTQAAAAYAGDNQYKPPQGAYAGYQPGAAGQV